MTVSRSMDVPGTPWNGRVSACALPPAATTALSAESRSPRSAPVPVGLARRTPESEAAWQPGDGAARRRTVPGSLTRYWPQTQTRHRDPCPPATVTRGGRTRGPAPPRDRSSPTRAHAWHPPPGPLVDAARARSTAAMKFSTTSAATGEAPSTSQPSTPQSVFDPKGCSRRPVRPQAPGGRPFRDPGTMSVVIRMVPLLSRCDGARPSAASAHDRRGLVGPRRAASLTAPRRAALAA